MCGILGGTQRSWNYEKAMESISYRGPDGSRLLKDENLSLGFVRLAIQDLSEKAMQPMTCKNENVTIVFNGEIYGYDKLKQNLIQKGYHFYTNSDTEVILNAYLEFGDNFINKFDGMFAIGIYDRRDGKVKLFRDRVGIKPLYYYYRNTEFAFASELKAITILVGENQFGVDNTAIYDYLTYQYIPEPKTLYKNIYKLEPASFLCFDINNKTVLYKKCYWRLKINETESGISDKTKDLEEETRRLIKKSVKEQLIADVPVGSLLSGGIDSSVVSYEVKQLAPELEAFSLGFSYKKYDELEYARLIADKNMISHNCMVANKETISVLYNKLPDWYTEPFADTSAFPTYLVSKLSKEKVDVVLTGDGGDEVFGGYSKYKLFAEQRKETGKDKDAAISLLYEALLSYIGGMHKEPMGELFLEDLVKICRWSGGMSKSIKQVWRKKLKIPIGYDDYWFYRKHYNKDLPCITRMQYLDFHTYLPGDILTKVDRASMQVSLEARVPLLSKELTEFSFNIPQNLRCPNGMLKGLLKNAYRGILPDEILDRRKMGFNIPNSYLKEGLFGQEEILKNLWGG